MKTFFSDHQILETKFEKHWVRPCLEGKVLLISKQDQSQLQTNSVCAAPRVYLLLIHLLHLCDKYQANPPGLKLRVAVSANLRVLVLIQFKFVLIRYKNDAK